MEVLVEVSVMNDKDARIANRVRECTADRVRNLTVSSSDGRTRISGRAGSYYVRQLAEQAVLRMVPADSVEFAIRVGC